MSEQIKLNSQQIMASVDDAGMRNQTFTAKKKKKKKAKHSEHPEMELIQQHEQLMQQRAMENPQSQQVSEKLPQIQPRLEKKNPPSMHTTKSHTNFEGGKNYNEKMKLVENNRDYSEEISVENAHAGKSLLDKSHKRKTMKEKRSTKVNDASSMNHWNAEEVIMSKSDFELVKQEYLQAENEQKKCGYRTRKCLSESMCGKFLCCCMKVKDKLNIPWEEMTPMQQKYRIKRLWMKARRVFLF